MCCLLMITGTLVPCHAQIDLGKIKNKAERVVKEATEEADEQDQTNQQERRPTTVPLTEPSAAATTGEDPEEMLRAAHRAVRPLMDIRSVYPGMLAQKNEAQNFHDQCKTAEYANNRTKAERAVQLDPDLNRREPTMIADITEKFLPHFNGLVTDYIIKEINGAIELAYAEKAKGANHAGAARDAAEAALLTAEGVLLVTPDNGQVQALRDDAKAAAESMGASFAAAVYTGEFHVQHVGEIVFAGDPITPGKEQSASIRNAFTASDNIYGMMYFKGTFSEATHGGNVAHTILLVDGNEMARYAFKLDGAERDASTLKSEILPDPGQSTTRGALIFTEKLKDISPRRHTITIRTTDDYNETIAEGSFSLDCTTGMEHIADVHRKLGEKKLANVEPPAPAMRNAALEKEMMTALGEWKETPLKVIITDRDWTIQYHPVTGAIVSRTINTTTIFRKPDGGCRMFEISFRQQYAGGKYGKTAQYGVGDSADILCEKAK
ncbi:MAG: hypothetical protein JXA28_13905 [Bacteroidetes bacterium]|nr:hypothetical protein [Bacteroidota bacterium]